MNKMIWTLIILVYFSLFPTFYGDFRDKTSLEEKVALFKRIKTDAQCAYGKCEFFSKIDRWVCQDEYGQIAVCLRKGTTCMFAVK